MPNEVALSVRLVPDPQAAAGTSKDSGSARPAAQVEPRTVAPAEPERGKKTPPAEPEAERIRRSVAALERFMSQVRRELEFFVDEESGHTVITVRNAETGEIVRQIPPDEVLQIASSLAEGQINLIHRIA